MRPLATILAALSAAALLLPTAAIAQDNNKRVAFVLGLNTFEHLPPQAQLRVAVADAVGMAETLESLDPPFKVTLVTEKGRKKVWTRDEVWESLERWMQEAKEAECALIYVASHGIEFHGQNYLLVGDTRIEAASEGIETMKRRLARASLSLQEMMDELDATQANVKVVILDACRDNPLQTVDARGTRSVLGSRGGLAAVSAPGGTLISYSADAGQQANDGLYTDVLRKHMAQPGVTLQEVFAATREEVVRESASRAAAGTGVRHEPAEYTKLNLAGTRFAFTRGVPVAVKVEAPGDSAEMEKLRAEMAELRKSLAAAEGNAAEVGRLQEELKKAQAKVATPDRTSPTGQPATPMARTDSAPAASAKAQVDAVKEKVREAAMAVENAVSSSAPSSGSSMARTDPAPAPAFPASRGMEGSRAGEMREFGGIEMVWCPPGTFRMGSSEYEEGRKVTLTRGFWLAKTETTQGQWQGTMKSNPSGFKGVELPVETVSWDDCQEWLIEMSRKHPLPEGWKWDLPTEAQWEYACLAGTKKPYDRSVSLVEMGWFAENSGGKTHAVGGKKGNEWGLHDMHGNVWEWCRDWYGDYPESAATDPIGAASGSFRVDRGNSWRDLAQYSKSTERHWDGPSVRVNYLGFRSAVVPKSGRANRPR